jgi:hypothetical protein
LETSLDCLCRYLISSNKIKIELKDLRGEGIERAKIFLNKVCDINFPETSNEWNEIKKLNKVRNCIIHAEGEIESAHGKEKLKNIIESTKGLALREENTIIVDRLYLDMIINYSETFLLKVYKESFK